MIPRSRVAALAAALCTGTVAPALALEEPAPCSARAGADPRVRCANATTDKVVLLRAERGAALLIELPDGERVVGVPVSDDMLMRGGRAGSVRVVAEGPGPAEDRPTVDGNLSVAVRGSTVVLKPHADLVPQPFFVLTERDGGRPTRYRFQLETVGTGAGFYSVRLRNVAAEEGDRRARWETTAAARQERAARERLAQASAAPCSAAAGVHHRFAGRGDAALAPQEACDDGRQTHLRFAPGQRIPAVEASLPDGRDGAVGVTPGPGGWVTVHARAPRLTLRDAGRALCILNLGLGMPGRDDRTGTVTPGVVREAVQPLERRS
ncbi:TrbG/VirB9 family P-type conjugative transfer protein [Roseomonas frigidaquae]|uniref:TrbG/VirB9 family P-type conjugative transfer protein n=1 Tax=Falsiroseomonas frigidaquae TaxID=487318 RepID=A0ABX1F848_9PROT|nr:TrbG/VirB9 family P-type conjugative transfer protein [Falsiroseomonas frigidaquae]NKE48560.1 TrbG/VirB9 family P-type conjugative transfer protein [Falsiroseomonas frigidaquae]